MLVMLHVSSGDRSVIVVLFMWMKDSCVQFPSGVMLCTLVSFMDMS